MSGTTRRLAAEGRGRLAIRVLTLISLLAGSLVVLAAPASAATGTRSNTTAILLYRPGAPPGCPSFPSPNNSCPPTPATLYPSPISVTGIDGTISDVNVTLNDLDYKWWDASDLDVMLVAPNGSRIMLMSDVCGDSVNSTTSLPVTSPIDLTFDDDAALTMPFDTACAGGTYRPTDEDEAAENFPFTGEDVFCGPPSSNPELCQPPTAAEASPTSTDLNIFNGISPTGTWKLYVVDDTPSDPGGDLDGFNGGWSLTITTAPAAPCLTVADTRVTEGDTGTVTANFVVSLSAASSQPVSVNYTTANGTAKAPADYSATSGTLTFDPGQTSRTVGVAVNGDTLYELAERFSLKLAGPTGATICDGVGLATIVNNDPKPTLTITDVSSTEGDSGTTIFTFTVRQSTVTGARTTVTYATADGTATAGSDYVAKTGTASIPAGATTATITVSVNGDLAGEPNETFFVNLTRPRNATLADTQAIGTITNDD